MTKNTASGLLSDSHPSASAHRPVWFNSPTKLVFSNRVSVGEVLSQKVSTTVN
jgi:hypothetical protein